MTDIVKIFDTTLRDGEQSPGASMTTDEKLAMARQLARLGVDIIEAGFPIASDGDFEAVRRIAGEVDGPEIAGLSRTAPIDIDRAWEAVRESAKPRIHTFIATSDIHLKYKLKMDHAQVLEEVADAVGYACSLTPNVEFSAEDATRSDLNYLCEIVEAAIDAGAKTINIPDTVGYTIPSEFAHIIRTLKEKVTNIDRATLSVHCHNDLGLAVANSLAAIHEGVRQVECTINGIGERAGNASLEEIVMALRTRRDQLPYTTNIDTTQIYPSSRLLTQITGIAVQPNKAVVGDNAFAHEAGIHQHGVLAKTITYEIMTPESIGLSSNKLVLGKHSGRHAFRDRLQTLGYELSDDEVNKAFKAFKDLADTKKEIFDEDIDAIIGQEIREDDFYELQQCHVSSGTEETPTARIALRVNGHTESGEATGDGPVDAAFHAIRDLTGTDCQLVKYSVQSITGGTDAQGQVTVRLAENGYESLGRGAHTDIIVASARAYVNALNKLHRRQFRPSASARGGV